MPELPRAAARRALALVAALGAAPVAGCAGGQLIGEQADDGGGGGGPDSCSSSDACRTMRRDASGACQTTLQPDGAACDDGDACTTGDACQQGQCQGGAAVVCAGTDACGAPPACDPASGCAAPGADCVAPTALALGGCSSNTYWTFAEVGQSGPIALILDTGSSSLGVADSTCSTCNVTPTYSRGQSAHATGKTASSYYVDGSGFAGTVVKDTVALVGGPSVTMDLVAITQQQTFFTGTSCTGSARQTNGTQGIIGFGPQSVASPDTDAFTAVLGAADPNHLLFAVQLCDSGGNLWIGGFDPNHALAAPVYTPLIPGPTGKTYPITIKDMKVGGVSIGLSSAAYGPADVDTGTTELVVTTAVFNALVPKIEANATFAAAFGANFLAGTSCMAAANGFTRTQLDQALAPLSITLPGVGNGAPFSLSLPPTASYLLIFGTDANGAPVYCPALSAIADPQCILGAAFLRSLLTVFAVGQGAVGFAPQSGCPY